VKPSRPEQATVDEAGCKRAAIGLLARREHSRLELARKLAARGFPDAVIAAALDALERTGLLAAARFLESFVRARVAKGQGPVRIRAELGQRGVTEQEADELLASPELDWVAQVRAVHRKRFGATPPRDYRERARQARFLQYRGFTSDQVRAALELDADSD
jgi:regulatory protein